MKRLIEKVKNGNVLLKKEMEYAVNNFSEEDLVLLCKYDLTPDFRKIIAKKIFSNKTFVMVKIENSSCEIIKITNEKGKVFNYEDIYSIFPALPLPQKISLQVGNTLTFYFVFKNDEAEIPDQDFLVE